MRFGKIESDTQVPLSHVIPEGKQQGKSDITRSKESTHKYNTRFRVNHVTTFKNIPQMFQKVTTDTSTTHIGAY